MMQDRAQKLTVNSLWIMSAGLMLASSGWDGAFLAKLMPFAWMGYLLNTVADFAGLVIIYWYGRLRQCPKSSKKHKLAIGLLPAELLALCYSWCFSWLQLRVVMIPVEGKDTVWIAPIVAAYIPMQLFFIGVAQALLEGRWDQADVDRKNARREKATLEKARIDFATTNSGHRKAPDLATWDVMMRDGWNCYYCGLNMQNWPREQIHVDHFYPTSLGGSDDSMNLVVSCKKCNLSKNANPPTEDEVRKFQIHLVKKSEHSKQEKIWLLNHMSLVEQQKGIATELGVSRSYVSASLKKLSGKQNGHLASFCEQLSQVGRPRVNQEQQTTTAGQLA